jgi:hypothetical protein
MSAQKTPSLDLPRQHPPPPNIPLHAEPQINTTKTHANPQLEQVKKLSSFGGSAKEAFSGVVLKGGWPEWHERR